MRSRQGMIKDGTTESDDPLVTRRMPNGQPITTTYELKLLRAQVARLEKYVQGLEAYWSSELVDTRTLEAGRNAAKEKYWMTKAEEENRQLKKDLLQQQYAHATLQSDMLRAPLRNCSMDVHCATHFNTYLSNETSARAQQFLDHCNRSLRTIPDVVMHYTSGIDPSLDGQVHISGGEDYTIATGLICVEFPGATVEDLFECGKDYDAFRPRDFRHHFNIQTDHRILEEIPADCSRAVYEEIKLKKLDSGVATHLNQIGVFLLQGDFGLYHSDAVAQDDRHGYACDQNFTYSTVSVLVYPASDSTPEAPKSIMRRMLSMRVRGRPNDALTQKCISNTMSVINNDLFVAFVVRRLHERKAERRQDEHKICDGDGRTISPTATYM